MLIILWDGLAITATVGGVAIIIGVVAHLLVLKHPRRDPLEAVLVTLVLVVVSLLFGIAASWGLHHLQLLPLFK